MISFIQAHRDRCGVEPICKVLQIAPSTYYARAAIARNPDLASNRVKQDAIDREKISEVYEASGRRYGARKIWHDLRQSGESIAKCTVERLMKDMQIQGVVRGKKAVTTNPDDSQSCPLDKVNRNFTAHMPNQLWLSDFTYVSTWQGNAYTAFIIDVFARQIVGWRVSTSMTTSFVLDALNQAICQRVPSQASNLIHHSDRGSQYLSIKYTERLAEVGIDPSVGSVGDSYDNAMAESVIGLYKTEVINHLGPWKSRSQLEWETLKWVDWYNQNRLHSALNYQTPNQKENNYFQNLNAADKVA